MVLQEFDSYGLDYYSGDQSPHNTDSFATLRLSFNGKYVAFVGFYDRLPIPNNSLGILGRPHLSFHINRFNDIIKILRYEKPLYVWMDPPHSGGIRTWKEEPGVGEPIGEEES